MTTRIEKPAQDGDAVPDPAEDAAERVAAAKEEVMAMVEEKIEALGKAIQQRPLLAVSIGVGIGYLLARLLHD